jgi:hypothetical protein
MNNNFDVEEFMQIGNKLYAMFSKQPQVIMNNITLKSITNNAINHVYYDTYICGYNVTLDDSIEDGLINFTLDNHIIKILDINRREIIKMNFGEALENLKNGKKITREGWNGKGMYVFMAELRINELSLKFLDNKGLIIKTPTGKFNNWVPSITDLLAEDWAIV